MDGSNLNTALIGALSALVASLLTWLGVRRKAESDQAAALLRAGVDMHQLATETALKVIPMLREEFQHELARAENARRDAEALVDALTQQLAVYRAGYRKVVAVLCALIGPEGLDEISDLPEDV